MKLVDVYSLGDEGIDLLWQLLSAEFKQMVTECRRAAAAIGVPSYGPGPNESTALRRSLWVTRDTKRGEPLVLGFNVKTARPALGLSPSFDLAGKLAAKDIAKGTALTMEMLA